MGSAQETYLPSLHSRQAYLDYLDGYAVDRADELRVTKLKKALVKTFLFETVAQDHQAPDAVTAFQDAGIILDRVDDSLFTARPGGQQDIWGLVELLERRHPVLYTLLDSQSAKRWWQNIIHASPWLDRVWLSAPIFTGLWEYVRRTCPPRRFSRMVFEYEARFEWDDGGESTPAQEQEPEELDEEIEPVEASDELDQRPERRASRCTVVERISEIESRLTRLQEVYQPFHSIAQLRIPAPSRGGHDFYYDGRVTNHSDSFLDHRQQVAFVLRLYRNTTESAEQALWMSAERTGDEATEAYRLHGAPVLMRFSELLSESVFQRWMSAMFARRSRFRLWGNPIAVGPSHVHVYGVDRHLWQPIYLEFTRRHALAVLPKGTCGNTVHRLVTNVQRFVDAGVKSWIGETEYASVINRSLATTTR